MDTAVLHAPRSQVCSAYLYGTPAEDAVTSTSHSRARAVEAGAALSAAANVLLIIVAGWRTEEELDEMEMELLNKGLPPVKVEA